MKICCMCWNNNGKVKPATKSMNIGIESFDLCETCSELVREVINGGQITIDTRNKEGENGKTKGKKPGRPRKGTTTNTES